ncbi:hypothetical protein QQ020_23200 [Fulvivirgaceae bacterium BMA12]|uniref:Uncharacterized protein n=1 Tax=Agaribacillus aureus TaxID=3051825 RepID=A0ABT8LB60_9BACT|nr:hypothetical protein [Fulvivirgaceae bacterium BMA12]
MKNIPHFLSLLKAHKLLWAIMVSSNLDLVQNSNLPYQESKEGNFKSYKIRELCLSDEDCFLQTAITYDSSTQYLMIKLISRKEDYFSNVEKYFGSENLYSVSKSPITSNNLSDKSNNYYTIEYPDFEIPMTANVSYYGTLPNNGKLTTINIFIPKSGKIKLMKDVNTDSLIRVIPINPLDPNYRDN